MKTQRYLSLLSIICLSLLLVKCGKNGAIGPQGNAGDKGQAGAVGPAGPAGANGVAGSVIYSGNTAPAADKGIAGDFYLNTANGLLYGPKTANGWGTGFSLKGSAGATGATGATGTTGAAGATGATGPAGATGTAGSTTLSGAGLPAGSLGKTGDYYLDKTNYLLYGPKTGTSWGVPVNLQGPAGPQGPEGNANVKVDVFTVKTDDWIYSTAYYFEIEYGASETALAKYFDHKNSLITADLLSSGMVLVYFQSTPSLNLVNWQPLPFSFTYEYDGYASNYAYQTLIGSVRLYFFFNKVSVYPPSLDTYKVPTHQFKMLLVSGTLLGSIRQNHINVNNYNEVSRFLAIQ
ncbi:MAG: hypothetical protein JWR09_209 [Mucilaginibacter sp.]|nr:hypothetical protein [Mucilaginibacter sp.]